MPNPNVSIGMAGGRKLPPEFHSLQPQRGRMGGIESIQMVNPEAEQRWKEPMIGNSDRLSAITPRSGRLSGKEDQNE
jgi:hypothetical protein